MNHLREGFVLSCVRSRVASSAFLGVILLSGCVKQLPEVAVADTTPVLIEEPIVGDKSNAWVADAVAVTATPAKQLSEHTFIGSDQLIGAGVSATPVTAGEGIRLRFNQTPLKEVVNVILNDVLGASYFIEPGITGEVTIEMNHPVDEDELLGLLETILEINGAALVKQGNLYRVTTASRDLMPRVFAGGESAGSGVAVYPLRYVAAAEMLKLIEPLATMASDINIDERRNLLLVSGNQNQLSSVTDAIELFDVDWMAGMSVALTPVRHAEPTQMIDELSAVLHGVDGGLLAGMVKVTAMDRLSAILVVSPRAEQLRRVNKWIGRLDRPGNMPGQRLFVRPMLNAKAEDIANILNDVLAGASHRNASKGVSAAADLMPGLTPFTITSPPAGGGSGQSASTVPGVESGVSAIALAGEQIKVIADDINNSLVILGTASQYAALEKAIAKLDITPLQVLIEATIIEVSLDDTLEFGVEWFFRNSVGDKQGSGILDLDGAGLSRVVPSFSYSVTDAAGQVRAMFNTLASESDLRVVSSPSLMVLNNQTATINVGDEIPIPIRQATSNLDPDAPTVNEIEYRRTGVILTVTPRVNSGGLVTLEITQQVSDAVVTTTSGLNAPTIRQREIQTMVAVNDGDSIVLGGLIGDALTQTDSGVPYLYRVPYLGRLFGQRGNSKRRSELLIMLSPRVVNNRKDSDQITKEYRQRLREFGDG